MQIHANDMINHLRHDSFPQFRRIRIHIHHQFRGFQPGGVKTLVQVFEFLVELEGPGEGLLGDALVAVDDFAGEHADFVHEDEGGEVGAGQFGEREVAVRIYDSVGEAEEEGDEAVGVVEGPEDGFVGGGGGAFAVEALDFWLDPFTPPKQRKRRKEVMDLGSVYGRENSLP